MVEESLLYEKIRTGFQSSAYRGVTGALHPPEQDDRASGKGLRLAQMISDKLEPFPSTRPTPHVKDVYKPTTINNKSFTFKDESRTTIMMNPPEKTSSAGVVPNGLRDSRAFLETLSSTQRMTGRFDDDAAVADPQERGGGVGFGFVLPAAAKGAVPPALPAIALCSSGRMKFGRSKAAP